MPRKKCTAQEIKGHIHELVEENLERTKNVDWDLKFQKYQKEKKQIGDFLPKTRPKKSEYSAIFI